MLLRSSQQRGAARTEPAAREPEIRDSSRWGTGAAGTNLFTAEQWMEHTLLSETDATRTTHSPLSRPSFTVPGDDTLCLDRDLPRKGVLAVRWSASRRAAGMSCVLVVSLLCCLVSAVTSPRCDSEV